MRPLGFLVSVLLHAVFLLLLLHARFPMGDVPAEMRVIEIVPMAPPLAATVRPGPPPEPPLVYVRPFVLKGGAPGAANGSAAGKGEVRAAAAGSGGHQRSAGGNGSLLASAPAAKEGDAARRLTVDMKRIESELTGNRSPGTAGIAGTGALAATGKGMPFGDPGGNGRDGDGTVSSAMAGNAFFDSRGYDITPWAQRLVYRVKKNWIMPPASSFGLKGTVGIYMVIARDGSIARVFVRKASGVRPLDQAAYNAIRLSAPLPPLPDDFPRADLPAYLLFYYK